MNLFDPTRFRKFKTRRKGKVWLTYWQDKMTGHLYAVGVAPCSENIGTRS